MKIQNSEGQALIRINDETMEVERVWDRGFAELYETWLDRGFEEMSSPEEDEDGVLGDTQIQLDLVPENIGAFEIFLNKRGYQLVD